MTRERVGDTSHVVGHWSRPRGDDQALRVWRPPQSPSVPDRAQRRATGGRASGPALARGLRSGRDRGPHPIGHVLLVDLSMSMPMRTTSSRPRRWRWRSRRSSRAASPDYLGIVVLGSSARDQGRGAAHRHVGLRLRHEPPARAGPRPSHAGHQHGTKQIICVTDGEPTAHIEPDARCSSTTAVAETLRRTMAEVVRCTRAGIMINMFASTSSARSTLRRADRPTQRRRTFYTTPDSLVLCAGGLPEAPPVLRSAG